VRRISTELRPSILDTLGVVAAIEWLAKDHQERSGIPCAFITSLTDIDLLPDLATTVFRICQEALTNVARHAKATQVSIKLEVVGGVLVLEIWDNGSGLTEQQISNPKSLGILGMKERAHIFGGEVTFSSHGVGGTRVKAEIPLVKPMDKLK
jgi:signal transduction histidine kinase